MFATVCFADKPLYMCLQLCALRAHSVNVSMHLVGLRLCLHYQQSQPAIQLHKVIKANLLSSKHDQAFLCLFIVHIECLSTLSACWIAKSACEWDAEAMTHNLKSCCVCPAFPAKEMLPDSIFCNDLDDTLIHSGASDEIILTDLLLMTSDAPPRLASSRISARSSMCSCLCIRGA